jgi:hypothetical protein
MTINVTPIPRLLDLAAPAFTLGTANAAGSAQTAVASDSTLLAFDTTLPDAITFGQSGAVGTSETAARRSHAHAMAAEPVAAAATQAEQEAGTSTTVFVTPGRQQYHESTVKVWGTAGDTGVIASPSYNVASFGKNSTGNYTITFDVDFSDNDQGIGITMKDQTGEITTASPATGTIIVKTHDDGGTLADRAFSWVFSGDQ